MVSGNNRQVQKLKIKALWALKFQRPIRYGPNRMASWAKGNRRLKSAVTFIYAGVLEMAQKVIEGGVVT